MDLKLWQLEHRWSNKALAKAIGANEGTISHVKNKKRQPSLLLVTAIVHFTKGEVTVEDLMIKNDLDRED